MVNNKNMWDLGVRTGRIEALCDGVFAIAMTILVLELSLDHVIVDTFAWNEGGNFEHALVAVYSYVLGFIILGIYWSFHHYIFHFIKRSNGALVWLNILFLMFASLVPFSTVVGTRYVETHSDSYPGFVFNMITMLITFWILLAIWRYATNGYRLVDKDMDKEIINFVNKIIIVGSSLAVLIVILAFLNRDLGFLAFIPMAYVIIAIVYGHHKPFF